MDGTDVHISVDDLEVSPTTIIRDRLWDLLSMSSPNNNA